MEIKKYYLNLPNYKPETSVFQPVVSPFDRQPVGEVEIASPEALENALDTARKYQDEVWSKTPAWKRSEILRKAASIVKERADELAFLSSSEGGKPLKDAKVGALRAAVTLEQCADAATKIEGKEWGMQRAPGTDNKLAFTIREPIGVVLAISAFNHPINLPAHQAGSAIAAGNCCILKPASSTPLCAVEIRNILIEAGLPGEVLQVIVTPSRNANVLVQSDKIDFLGFIGSGEIGWKIRREIAEGTRMAAEHGGTAASIVLNDADLDNAIPLILRASYYHAGQVCVSTQKLYVEKGIQPEFTKRLLEGASKLVPGDARVAGTDIGALIEPGEVSRVHEWVGEAVNEGAELLLGGEPISDTLYPATILRNADENSKVIKEEIFGPVVIVQTVDSLEEAIEKVNTSDHPFQSSIFTQDIDKAFRAARSVKASAYMINDHTAFRVDWMPFGGRKKAGLSLGGVEHEITDMTQEKLIVMNLR